MQWWSKPFEGRLFPDHCGTHTAWFCIQAFCSQDGYLWIFAAGLWSHCWGAQSFACQMWWRVSLTRREAGPWLTPSSFPDVFGLLPNLSELGQTEHSISNRSKVAARGRRPMSLALEDSWPAKAAKAWNIQNIYFVLSIFVFVQKLADLERIAENKWQMTEQWQPLKKSGFFGNLQICHKGLPLV